MYYIVDERANPPNRGKGGNPEISNSRRPLPPLGLVRQKEEMNCVSRTQGPESPRN